MRRILVLSAVLSMVLATGPAAWAGGGYQPEGRRGAERPGDGPADRAFVGEWHRAGAGPG